MVNVKFTLIVKLYLSEEAKESKLSIIKILEQLSLDENVARMICDEPMLTNNLIPSINDLSVDLKIALIEMVLKSNLKQLCSTKSI